MLPKVFSPPKELEKKSFPKFLKILIVLIIIAGFFGYIFFYSSFFKIKNIVIDSLPQDTVAFVDKFKGQNIFFIDREEIKNEINSKFPEIENIKIIRGLPDTLKISVIQGLPKLIWKTEQRLFLVDGDGVIFKEVQGQSDLPIVSDNKDLPVDLGSQVASANFIDFIVTLATKFNQTTGFQIVNFEVNETIFQVDALTDQGWKVKFDTTRSADEQLSDLEKFLAEHKNDVHQYADVRVEGRVYYK
jgi:cell division septal protein FtsQ